MTVEIVDLEDSKTGASARVLISLGFNCFSWKAPFAGGQEPRELLWAAPEFEKGNESPTRSGIPLLFPFPGRIRGESFEFEGKRYPLQAGDGQGNAIHGYAFKSPWTVIASTSNSVTAQFQPSVNAPEYLGMWTGDYRLEATYRVINNRLEFVASFENLGDSPLPYGFGTHAYFRLPLSEGSDPEQTQLHAPLLALWRDENLVPTGDLNPLESYAKLIEGTPLAGQEFDTPFQMMKQENPTMEVVDPGSGRTVRQTCDASMTSCVIYTPPHREAVCLEPYTCVPNAFELGAAGVETGLQLLTPGEKARTTVLLEALTQA